ncbi:MAG: hlyA 3 [Gemmataceae bacterium]|nr:hlyA 3 [Gemmataceae bacterium]
MDRKYSPARAAHRQPRLGVEVLESRDVPAFLTGAEVAVGASAGGPPLVQLIDPSTGTVQTQFLAFDSTFYGGVRVAVGDVTGDGHPDLVVAADRGGGPQVKVYDGQTGAVVASFFAYDPSFQGGVYVAIGDVTGNGKNEIITGPGLGGGPQVNVFDGSTGNRLTSFLAYAPSFRGGVRVAAGALDTSGTADIVTAPGSGGGPDVRTFRLPPGLGTPTQVGGFFAYDPSFTGGVFVAVGDVTGGGAGEIVTGPGAGGGPRVGVFTPGGTPVASFFAYAPSFLGGVRVAAADLSGTGVADVITGPGSGGGPQVNVFSLPSTTPLASFFGLAAGQTVGVSVAGSQQPINVPATPAAVISSAFAQYQAAQAAAQTAQAAAQTALTRSIFFPPILPDTVTTVDPFGLFTPAVITPTGTVDF